MINFPMNNFHLISMNLYIFFNFLISVFKIFYIVINRIQRMIAILLHLLGFSFCPKLLSVLQKLLWAVEK